jgi:tryptophan synthase alpha chain
MSGLERIAQAFAAARADGRAALMPYLMGGYPDLETSRRIAVAYAEAGADLIELGIPYSDPLADGPVIHAAGARALDAGASLPRVLTIARPIADHIPVVVMCYANLVFARGTERFLDAVEAAALSGLIVPDLPFEEAADLADACERRGLALVPLVAPTTPPDRLHAIGARARGFLYTVSVTGTTGERTDHGEGIAEIVARAASATEVPVAVGFGIATPEQARAAAQAGAEGVIVGSRLVRAAGEAGDPVPGITELVRDFSDALQRAPLS